MLYSPAVATNRPLMPEHCCIQLAHDHRQRTFLLGKNVGLRADEQLVVVAADGRFGSALALSASRKFEHPASTRLSRERLRAKYKFRHV